MNLLNANEIYASYLKSVFINPGVGWKNKKLGEVCHVIGGGTPSKGNHKFYSGNIFWATVRDMKQDIIKDTDRKITQDAVKNSSTNIVSKGNVVIATRVGLGKICIIENDTAINQDLKGIIPKKKEEITTGYLFQWFKSISNLIIEEGTGATVQGVKLPFINGLEIPIPSLAKQKNIVEKLDALCTQTKKLEDVYQQKLDNLEELKKAILQTAFNGEL